MKTGKHTARPLCVLVTGAAGYIGSHTSVELLQAGYRVVGADNCCNAVPSVIDRIAQISGQRIAFYPIDISDRTALHKLFATEQPDAVIHFAGFKAVNESIEKPLAYYRNNLTSAITLLEVMEEFRCRRLIFSSSATVYGPENPYPYTEAMPAVSSFSPYGRTKIMVEQILTDYCAVHSDFSAVLLRYFNPIGSHSSGLLGDDPNGTPNNLMPYIVRVAAGKLEKLTVFGSDYPTPDGTCQRDYLHVVDLAQGHLKALEYAMAHNGAEAFNLGTGRGVSVMELIETFERVNNLKLRYVLGPRRAGDLPAFWADVSKAKALLGWVAKSSIEDMCRSAWHYAKNAQYQGNTASLRCGISSSNKRY